MDILRIVHKEFNKGQRKATRALINDVIANVNCTASKKIFSQVELSKKHRVSSNKLSDLTKYIKILKQGASGKFLGVTGYTYNIEIQKGDV